MKIGIFDSGIGGLSVLYEAMQLLPHEQFIYYADEKHVPYGEKTREEIIGYVDEIIQFMIKRDCKAIVIACNTATSAAVSIMRKKYHIPIIGMEPAVKKAAKILSEGGAKRVIELNVSGPFHSKFLKTAGQKMSNELEKVNLTELEVPYVTNVTGEYVNDISETKGLLVKQISSPVKWEQSVRNMINNGVDTFVEIGPGKTLTGFIRKIDRSVKCINISTVDDLDKLKEIRL